MTYFLRSRESSKSLGNYDVSCATIIIITKKDNGDRELCANLIVICQFFITIKHFEAFLGVALLKCPAWILNLPFFTVLTLETIIELSTQSAWDIFSITPTTDLIQFL